MSRGYYQLIYITKQGLPTQVRLMNLESIIMMSFRK